VKAKMVATIQCIAISSCCHIPRDAIRRVIMQSSDWFMTDWIWWLPRSAYGTKTYEGCSETNAPHFFPRKLFIQIVRKSGTV
jgi:hypothetical protein